MKRLKSKKRLQELSFREKHNSMLNNIEVAGILSEVHPIAAGVYNTTYFVIINQKKQKPSNIKVEFEGTMSTEIGCDEKENIISNEKPKYTYRELITLALADKTCLTLSNIYSWISKFFPFYSASDEKWKNSIRHNLSLYPEFVKGEKTPDGAGHLWHLEEGFRKDYLQNRDHRLRRKSESINTEVQFKNLEALAEDVVEEEMKAKEIPKRFYQEQSLYRDLISSPELQKSAEEILAGVKRPTAVVPTLNECLETFTCFKSPDFYDREA